MVEIWKLLANLYVAVQCKNHEQIEQYISRINQYTKFHFFSHKDWEKVFEVLSLQWSPARYEFTRCLLRLVHEPIVDLNSFLQLTKLKMISRTTLVEFLCEIKEFELLIQLVESRVFKVCFRKYGGPTLFTPLLLSEPGISESTKQLIQRYYKQFKSTKPFSHRFFCLGQSRDMYCVARKLIYENRSDGLIYMIDHCDLLKYVSKKRLFYLSATRNNFVIVEKLIKMFGKEKFVLQTKESIVYHAAANGCIEMVDYLLELGFSIGHIESFFDLLSNTAKPHFMKDSKRLLLLQVLKKYGYRFPIDIKNKQVESNLETKRFKNIYTIN